MDIITILRMLSWLPTNTLDNYFKGAESNKFQIVLLGDKCECAHDTQSNDNYHYIQVNAF